MKKINRIKKTVLKELEKRLTEDVLTIRELKDISDMALKIEESLKGAKDGREAIDIINTLINKYETDTGNIKPIIPSNLGVLDAKK